MFAVKVAVAIAIIKGKPDDMSSQDYAESLQRKLMLKQLQLGNDYTDALMKISRLEAQLANTDVQNKETGDEVSKVLTPPPSDNLLKDKVHPSKRTEEFVDNTELITSEIENSKFIESAIGLENLSSSVQEHKSEDFIIKTATDNLTTISTVLSRDLVAIPESCLCKAAESVSNLLCHYPWLEDNEVVMQRVFRLIETVLAKIKRPSNLHEFPPHRQKHSLMQMLVTCMRGHSPHCSLIIMDSLLDAWEEFCYSLRSSRNVKTLIDPPLFESSFFIIHAMESAMKSWTDECNVDFASLQMVQGRLEKSLLHLADIFPLVARAVWKVTAAIERILISHKTRIRENSLE